MNFQNGKMEKLFKKLRFCDGFKHTKRETHKTLFKKHIISIQIQ